MLLLSRGEHEKHMQVRFFDPGKVYLEHHSEMLTEIDRVLTKGDLILRQDVEDFEHNLAQYLGRKHAIGLNSGTDALYLSLWALGIKPGDEVITSGHTFVASAQVAAQLGAKPVLVDVRDDLVSSERDLYNAITDKTKAIIPVHLTGIAVQAEDYLLRAMDSGIKVVEDACQALGAKGVGYGDTQCYSFYPAKILGAYGDAGAVTTDDDDLAAEIRELRNHYKKDYSKWGINSRLDNLQAAILNIRLKYLSISHLRRAAVAHKYKAAFQRIEGLTLPAYYEGRVWQDYVIRTDRRDELYTFLKEHGVETMKNDYLMPIKKPKNALKIESETLRIPCNDILEDVEVDYVIQCIQGFYAEKN